MCVLSHINHPLLFRAARRALVIFIPLLHLLPKVPPGRERERESTARLTESLRRRGAFYKGNCTILPPYRSISCSLWDLRGSSLVQRLSCSPAPASASLVSNLFNHFIHKVPIDQQRFRENNEEIIGVSWRPNYARMESRGQEWRRRKCFLREVSNVAFTFPGSGVPGGHCVEWERQRRSHWRGWFLLPVSGKTTAFFPSCYQGIGFISLHHHV